MTRRKNIYRSTARFHEAERLSAANALADPEKVLSLFDAACIAEKLESHAAVALFQNNSKKTELVTLQTPKNIIFGLPNKILFEPSRLETYLQPNHNESGEKKHEASQAPPNEQAGWELLREKRN